MYDYEAQDDNEVCIVKTLVNAWLHFVNHCFVYFTAKAIDDRDVKVVSAMSIFDAFTDIRATLRNFRRNIYHVQFSKLRSRFPTSVKSIVGSLILELLPQSVNQSQHL